MQAPIAEQTHFSPNTNMDNSHEQSFVNINQQNIPSMIELSNSKKREPWKLRDIFCLLLLPIGLFLGLTGVGASNAPFYILLLVVNTIVSLILCSIICWLFGGFLANIISIIITKFFTPKDGQIIHIVESDRDYLPIGKIRFSLRSAVFWTLVLVSINVLILSNHMDKLYADDGGNKSPQNLEEVGYMIIWFLSGLIPSLLLPIIIPFTIILNCSAVIADINDYNIKKVSSNVKGMLAGFGGASAFLAIFKFVLANSGDPNGWGRLDSSQPLLAIFAIVHGSLFAGFLVYSIWHRKLMTRVENILREKVSMSNHKLISKGNGIELIQEGN
mgnify:CR=1 FL=1